MLKLYRSNHFALHEIRSSGKKEIRGVLCFKGMRSPYGSAKEVTAFEGGTVIYSGINYDHHSRAYRRGMMVTVMGREGVTVSYGRLAHRMVEEGDYVHPGQVIGIEGDTGAGSGEYLTLEFRKNGRRVDGCEYLGIAPEPREFKPPIGKPAEMVCQACGISDDMRSYIDCNPKAPELWAKLLTKLQKA